MFDSPSTRLHAMISFIAVACTICLSGCKKSDPAAPTSGGVTSKHDHPAEKSASGAPKPGKDEHGVMAALGTVKVGGWTLAVSMAETLSAGTETAFEVKVEGGTGEVPSVYLSLVDAKDAVVSAPAKGTRERGGLHFHVDVPRSSSPEHVVLRVRGESLDETAKLEIPAARRGALVGSHDGFVMALSGTTPSFAEVKLHDDSGDIELWLWTNADGKTPFDVPLTTRPTMTFADLGGRVVELAPRDSDKNPDEDGHANIRDGKTNYFVFPGGSGADASAFKGPTFRSRVTIAVAAPSGASSGELLLRPHAHHENEEGGHKHADKHDH